MRLKDISQTLIDDITLTALKAGWMFKQFDKNTGMISFIKEDQRINIFLTTLTVATTVNHPKSGRNQLYRKGLTLNQIYKLFNNPRNHTGAGYRRKKDDNRSKQ